MLLSLTATLPIRLPGLARRPGYGTKEFLCLSPPMSQAAEPLRRLLDLVAVLRSDDGCPWDREQTLRDLRAYLLEEAHEAAAAIDAEEWDELCDELGDLLFQIVFIVRLAEERSRFGLKEVVERIEAKMIRRHPHVFGDVELADSAAVRRAWEQRKLEARQPGRSLLAGVPSSLPALLAAYRITQKAAGVGFDWPDAGAVVDKLDEEVDELRRALETAARPSDSEVREELGDLLFTVANLARHLGIDPEAALAAANAKFRRRFARLESLLAEQGRSFSDSSLDDLEALWQSVKTKLRR